MRPGEFPRYLVHDPDPYDGSSLSGWQIFVGDEPQADADDLGNFQIHAVSTLTDAHPELRQVLAVGVTGSREWGATSRRNLRLPDE